MNAYRVIFLIGAALAAAIFLNLGPAIQALVNAVSYAGVQFFNWLGILVQLELRWEDGKSYNLALLVALAFAIAAIIRFAAPRGK